MRKRILLLAAVQTLILTIPMATHAYAHESQLARAEPAQGTAIWVEPLCFHSWNSMPRPFAFHS